MQALGDKVQLAIALLNLAGACLLTADPQAALEHVQRARKIAAKCDAPEQIPREQAAMIEEQAKLELRKRSPWLGKIWNGGIGARGCASLCS